MARKTLTGVVVSTKMTGSVVVEVTRRTPHEIYKKLIKRSKKFVVDSAGQTVAEGDIVKIVETKKMGKNKFFALATTDKEGSEK